MDILDHEEKKKSLKYSRSTSPWWKDKVVKNKTLRTNGGGKYVSKDFGKNCDQEGVVHEVAPPNTPQHNGISERENRPIMNMVISMLKGKYLPKEL